MTTEHATRELALDVVPKPGAMMNDKLRWIGVVSISLTVVAEIMLGDLLGAASWCLFGALFFLIAPTFAKYPEITALRIAGWSASLLIIAISAFRMIDQIRHLTATR